MKRISLITLIIFILGISIYYILRVTKEETKIDINLIANLSDYDDARKLIYSRKQEILIEVNNIALKRHLQTQKELEYINIPSTYYLDSTTIELNKLKYLWDKNLIVDTDIEPVIFFRKKCLCFSIKSYGLIAHYLVYRTDNSNCKSTPKSIYIHRQM